MHSLPLFHRLAGERVVVIGTGEMAAAKRRLVERAGGVCCEGDDSGRRLAFVALEDPSEAEEAASRLKTRGYLVNVADRPELCDFTLPSVLERGPVLVAISTGGASAGLAKQLRLRLEGLLPSSLADLAQRLAHARERMRSRWPDANERRRALDDALSADGPLDPLDDGSARRVASWLSDPAGEPATSCVVEIDLTSSDPDDLTLRQSRALGAADTVRHAPDMPAAILNRARADAVRETTWRADEPPPPGLTVVLRFAP